MKKLLSYLWPQTTKIPSEYSGELEITLYNGKKMLDTKNANYSFGSLQQILEIGLTRIDFTNLKSVLVLGLGGGSVVQSLRDKFGYKHFIHAIELDEKIIKIAKNEFGIKPSKNLCIENRDALEFVNTCNRKYNLVIVDVFIDNCVPEQFYAIDFCENIGELLSEYGNVLFNLGFGPNGVEGRNTVLNFFKAKENFHVNLLRKVMGTNDLLLVKKRSH